MSEERKTYLQEERPVASIDQAFPPFANWDFKLIDGKKVLKNSLVEFAIEGVAEHIVTAELSTWRPVGRMIDEEYVEGFVRYTGRYITPNGLVDALIDRELAISTLKENPYHLTIFVRRFDSKDDPKLGVDVSIEGEKGVVVVKSNFGRGSSFYYDKDFVHNTVNAESFSLPPGENAYPLVLPQDPQFLKTRVALTVQRAK